MKRSILPALGLLPLLLACRAENHGAEPSSNQAAHAHEAPAHEMPSHDAPAAEPLSESEGPHAFGATLDESLEKTSLASIEAEPERFRDMVVRTEGRVARVCQAMGCWMELQAEGTRPIRVPMAGHAFFLPRDAAGRNAEIVGTVRIAELTQAMKEHLEAEGAVATGGSLAIDASAVVLR